MLEQSVVKLDDEFQIYCTERYHQYLKLLRFQPQTYPSVKNSCRIKVERKGFFCVISQVLKINIQHPYLYSSMKEIRV